MDIIYLLVQKYELCSLTYLDISNWNIHTNNLKTHYCNTISKGQNI